MENYWERKMKKILIVLVLAVVVVFLAGNVRAENDENRCKYESNMHKFFTKNAEKLGNKYEEFLYDDLLSAKTNNRRLFFLIESSRCDSFKEKHSPEIPSLNDEKEKIEKEISERNRINELISPIKKEKLA